MIFIPLSFCATLLLLILLARILSSEESGPGAWPFVLLLALFALQTVLVGLRWGYGLLAVLPFLTTFASAIPPASYLAFRSLALEQGMPGRRDLAHAAPMVLTILMFLLWRTPLDLLIILEFLGYGAALFWLGRHGPDGLVASSLGGVVRSWRALELTAVVLVCSALTDVAVSLDLSLGGGRHAGEVISLATTLILLLLGIAAATAGSEAATDLSASGGEGDNAAFAAGDTERADTVPSGEDAAIAEDLDRMMRERRLFTDSSLNLARLARRLGHPARSVSQAVNRVHGVSVSQYVNALRVEEACRLLKDTDMPVTSAFYEAGFMTKSNFNREFLRVTGKTPSAWRAALGSGHKAA